MFTQKETIQKLFVRASETERKARLTELSPVTY